MKRLVVVEAVPVAAEVPVVPPVVDVEQSRQTADEVTGHDQNADLWKVGRNTERRWLSRTKSKSELVDNLSAGYNRLSAESCRRCVGVLFWFQCNRLQDVDNSKRRL